MTQHPVNLGQTKRSIAGHGAKWRLASAATLLGVIAGTAEQAHAQEVRCPQPASESESASSGGQPASERLRHRDPLVRDMARADIAYDEGRREEAVAIYRRLAEVRPDRRQTARRAQLKLAQAAVSSGDFAAAEEYVARALRPGALPELQQRGRRIRASIANRQNLSEDEQAIEAVDALIAANRPDEALAASRALLTRSCPNPDDYASRAKIRTAQAYRAKGDLASARAAALDAQASAETQRGRDRVAVLLGELQTAERSAQLRGSVTQANALIAAGNAAGAIAILEPLLASQPPLPADLDTTVRLRLARAYVLAERYDRATAVLDPLLANNAALSAEDYQAASRIYLSRAAALQRAGNTQAAAAGYRQVLALNQITPDVRDSARLGLARALSAQGDRTGALQQIAMIRENPSSPSLLERANDLLGDIEGGAPMNRLYGYVQAGAAYDTNAPTLVSAVQDEDDDVSFPADEKFDDVHASFAGRLQYRHQLGQSADYIDLSATGLRTFQRKLDELDRTRVDLRAGPVFNLADGRTDLRFGAQYIHERRGGRFRYSEPGLYAGVRHELTDRLTGSAVYTLARHNDYREERDGTDHTVDAQLAYDASDSDVLTFDFRADREGAKVKRFRNTGIGVGAGWRHRFPEAGRLRPFVEASAEAERVRFDGRTLDLEKRRDWKIRAEAATGVDIDRQWRARLHYAFYDIDSNIDARDRKPNHQFGFSVRYSWN